MKAMVAIPILFILLAGGMKLNCTPDTLILCVALIAAGWIAAE